MQLCSLVIIAFLFFNQVLHCKLFNITEPLLKNPVLHVCFLQMGLNQDLEASLNRSSSAFVQVFFLFFLVWARRGQRWSEGVYLVRGVWEKRSVHKSITVRGTGRDASEEQWTVTLTEKKYIPRWAVEGGSFHQCSPPPSPLRTIVNSVLPVFVRRLNQKNLTLSRFNLQGRLSTFSK